MANIRKNINVDNIINLYINGVSINQLSKKFGVSRDTITKRLISADIKLRTQSESETLKWSKMDETTRKRQVQKAHEACRGRYISTAEKILRAKSAYESAFKKGEYEKEIVDKLREKGFDAVNQFNFGIYNIDIAIHGIPVFIEVQTSNHTALRTPKLLKRTKYILNSKKLLVYVVVDQTNKPIFLDLITDKIISYINILRFDKTILGKYLMIGRDGNPLPTTSYNFDGFTRIE